MTVSEWTVLSIHGLATVSDRRNYLYIAWGQYQTGGIIYTLTGDCIRQEELSIHCLGTVSDRRNYLYMAWGQYQTGGIIYTLTGDSIRQEELSIH